MVNFEIIVYSHTPIGAPVNMILPYRTGVDGIINSIFYHISRLGITLVSFLGSHHTPSDHQSIHSQVQVIYPSPPHAPYQDTFSPVSTSQVVLYMIHYDLPIPPVHSDNVKHNSV